MSEFKDFICNSTFKEPRTITYGNLKIISKGAGEYQYIKIYDKRRKRYIVCDIWFKIDYHKACSVLGATCIEWSIPIHKWLIETCDRYEDVKYEYDTWESVDRLMRKLVDYIRHNG